MGDFLFCEISIVGAEDWRSVYTYSRVGCWVGREGEVVVSRLRTGFARRIWSFEAQTRFDARLSERDIQATKKSPPGVLHAR